MCKITAFSDISAFSPLRALFKFASVFPNHGIFDNSATSALMIFAKKADFAGQKADFAGQKADFPAIEYAARSRKTMEGSKAPKSTFESKGRN